MSCNPYTQWLRAATGLSRGRPMPSAAALRDQRRGGMLDKHHGETGLTQIMAPGIAQRDLLQLSSQARNNPEVVTLSFGLEELATSLSQSIAHRIQGVISWGTGKGFNTAVVDIRHGAQVTLVANILNVAVRYLGEDGPTVRVSASVGHGNRPGGNAALTFTEEEQILGLAATSGALRIPNFATRVQWQSSLNPNNFLPPDAILQFRTSGEPAARIATQVAPPAAVWVAIPQQADFMRITNNGPAVTGYTLVYELML